MTDYGKYLITWLRNHKWNLIAEIFILGVLSGVALEALLYNYDNQIQKLIIKHIKLSDLITLIAAFGGAFLAFLFQNRSQRNLVQQTEVHQLRVALLKFIGQNERILDFTITTLIPQNMAKARWESLIPTLELNYDVLKVDISGLYFVTNRVELDVLRLQNAQMDFFQTIQAINFRNKFHIEQYQLRLQELEDKRN